MADAESVIDFWLNEVGKEGWYIADDAVDAAIRERFGEAVSQALDGKLDDWAETPKGCLALMILLDQFTRNLNRGSAEAFAGDDKACSLARQAIAANLDLEIEQPARQFFYVPFEHSEDMGDQNWSLALFKGRMKGLTEETMWHIEQHRETIRRFGRFPYRNEALGRESTPGERAYLEEGGYAPGKK